MKKAILSILTAAIALSSLNALVQSTPTSIQINNNSTEIVREVRADYHSPINHNDYTIPTIPIVQIADEQI